MLTVAEIKTLASQYGSPFYLVDRAQFESNFEALTAAFESRYRPFVLAYSYKTNYIPYLCRLVNDKGGWAEVVSRMEYDLALKVGSDPARIIFNGPVKRSEDIDMALSGGSLVNLDSEAEIDAVMKYADRHPDKTVCIGLRINIGLSDEAGVSHIQNSLKIGRFGFDPCDLGTIQTKLAVRNNVRVVSLHGHSSTTDRSVWCFDVIARTLVELAERFFANTVKFINIGGGMFGEIAPEHRWCQVPSFDQYAETVCSVLNGSTWVKRQKPALVIEPGVAMVANAVSFVTQVVSVKRIREKTFVTVDGSAFNSKPTFHKLNPPYEVLTDVGIAGSAQTFDVVGSTCMEKDILLGGITAPVPDVGDFIRLDNVGAYTVVMTPPFINPAPAILAQESDGVVCVRRRQTLVDVFAGYDEKKTIQRIVSIEDQSHNDSR
jgi:diaminopimelate decarboxylase